MKGIVFLTLILISFGSLVGGLDIAQANDIATLMGKDPATYSTWAGKSIDDISTIMGGGVAAGGGPESWFYTCTATPKVEPTWETGHDSGSNTLTYCYPVDLEAGNVTSFALKADETLTEYSKFALYSSDGLTYITGTTCTSNSFTTTGDGWQTKCDLVTPKTITTGTYYVCHAVDSNNYYIKHNHITSKTQITYGGYAGYPEGSYTLVSDIESICHAVRVYVE